MKLVMDEKLKHRLIGLAVIISLGAIFAPAVMKKSSQRLDSNMSVNVNLPPKPIAPNVVMKDEKEVFKTIKIAKADIPAVSGEKQLTELVKAEPIKNVSKSEPVIAKVEQLVKAKPVRVAAIQAPKKAIKISSHKSVPVAVKKKPVIKVAKVVKTARVATKSAVKKDIYALQLASFAQLTNAQALVTKLRGKGYTANFMKAPSRQGTVYKVYVGHSPRRLEVIKLKTQLASAMQLHGFVVNTGVS